MSDFLNYMLATERRKKAEVDHNRAGVDLELSQIRERLAEIKSQGGPLKELIEREISERDRLYSAAYYVVIGRMPAI